MISPNEKKELLERVNAARAQVKEHPELAIHACLTLLERLLIEVGPSAHAEAVDSMPAMRMTLDEPPSGQSKKVEPDPRD